MNQRISALAVGAVLSALCSPAEAQQPKKVTRIGYLSPRDRVNESIRSEGIQLALRELGHVEGQNILFEYRYADGKPDRLFGLATELVDLKVDLIVVAGGDVTVGTAKNATKTIPIVMVVAVDPVAAGIVDSLAHPGGNITGLTRLTRELNGKRLELLKEVIPRISRIGILWNADNSSAAIAFKEYEATASALKIQLQSLEVRGSNPDLEGAFQAVVKERASAVAPALLKCTRRIR